MKTKVGYRPTNISDARRMGLLPSVTTILSLLDKPLLNSWKIGQGVKAALEDPEAPLEILIARADTESRKAADEGTRIHDAIAKRLLGQPCFDITAVLVADAFIDWFHNNGFTCNGNELHFVQPKLGYGGTADLLGTYLGQPAIVDFKTQEFDDPRAAKHYEEHPYQLAAYVDGLELPRSTLRINIMISRITYGCVAMKIHKDSTDFEAWECLLKFWFMHRKYDPRII